MAYRMAAAPMSDVAPALARKEHSNILLFDYLPRYGGLDSICHKYLWSIALAVSLRVQGSFMCGAPRLHVCRALRGAASECSLAHRQVCRRGLSVPACRRAAGS